jgi:hypothetical protein
MFTPGFTQTVHLICYNLSHYRQQTPSFARKSIFKMTSNKAPAYRIYLLTVWREEVEQGASNRQWRFRLEDPQTGQHRLFAGEQFLVEQLIQWISGIERDNGCPEE